MFRFVDAANAITITALWAAFASVVLAINGLTRYALIALIVSGVCDLLDGMVAKRLSRDAQQQAFGGTLDSLVDGCAFGLAPSLMLYSTGMTSVAEMVILAALPVCVVWRVAYYELVGLQNANDDSEAAKSARRYYVGMPATYVALVVPLVANLGFFGAIWYRIGLSVTVALVCLAMVSRIHFRKPGLLVNILFVLLAMGATTVLAMYGAALPNGLQH